MKKLREMMEMRQKFEGHATELRLGVTTEREHKATLEWLKEYVEKNKEWPDLDVFAQHIAEDHLTGEGLRKYYTELLLPAEAKYKEEHKVKVGDKED